MPLRPHRDALEGLYLTYNRERYVHPDPLEFVRRAESPRDREVVALVASALAYGRVRQILASVQRVLDVLGPSPAEALTRTPTRRLARRLGGFRHRFATDAHLLALLTATREALDRYGSLEECFLAGVEDRDATVVEALGRFVRRLKSFAGGDCGHLLPDPAAGSACKRLHLMLRWMVRHDEVDLGCWRRVDAAKLIVPLDTHMHRLASGLGATRRKAADLRTALEITEAFRAVSPGDPVRYDFALTRLGIHPSGDAGAFLEKCRQNRKQP